MALTERDEERARVWYSEHMLHVNVTLLDTDAQIEPSPEDAAHPDRWKPMHWRWFILREVNKRRVTT